MKSYFFNYIVYISFISGFLLFSCKNRKLNYIEYYNRVYSIDSAYRIHQDTLATIKQYKKLFNKYPPVQNERLEEYEMYIKMADKYHKNFGGVKSLDKLITQVAPYWKSGKTKESDFINLYKKYGIDSTQIEKKVIRWREGLNKLLIDSFSIAFKRDQYNRHIKEIVEMNDKKNADLLLWTFKNYGYPSKQKIGLIGNEGVFMPMGDMLNHMAYTKYYEYFKIKLLEYVKSGECVPRDYIEMVDKYQIANNGETIYRIYVRYSESNLTALDSIRINRNRRKVGFPMLKESVDITNDFFKKLKKNNNSSNLQNSKD